MAREAVQTAGAEGVMEPYEQQLMFQDVSFKGDGEQGADGDSEDRTWVGCAGEVRRLDAVKGRPDVIEIQKQAEAARRKAQAGVAQSI